jgi:tRNA(fMet)-specific endonuclease VapC
VAASYGKIYQRLRASGQMIGTNDLWISAIAITNKLPVVTRNTAEFTRVPGLQVVGY